MSKSNFVTESNKDGAIVASSDSATNDVEPLLQGKKQQLIIYSTSQSYLRNHSSIVTKFLAIR